MKTLSISYLIAFTILLVVKNPLALFTGMPQIESLAGNLDAVAHLGGFMLLTVLMKVARWPISTWALLVLLACYGGATEMIQGLLPWRTAELADFLGDLAGIVLGWGLWWALARVAGHAGQSKDR